MTTGPQANKGIINIPTGGGKTSIMSRMVAREMEGKTGQVALVFAPRIALVMQISKDFWNNEPTLRQSNWVHQCYHSGADTSLDLLDGADRSRIDASFNVDGIVRQIQSGKNAILFSTYHSGGKLAGALIAAGVRANVLLCDEAHNLVTPAWNHYADPNGTVSNSVDNMFFFTATNKTIKNGDGGMSDLAWFGPILHRVDPRDLILQGFILPPRIIACDIEVDLSNFDKETGKYNNRDALEIVEKSIESFMTHHSHGTFVKTIVTCESAEQAQYAANAASDTLDDLGFKRFLVLSDVERTKGHLRPNGELEAFKGHQGNALIFQYDIISEGVDVPGVTAVLLLRGVSDIKAVQTIGRTLRLDPYDRQRVATGELRPGDWSSDWKKPYGAILVPVNKAIVDSRARYADIAQLVQQVREYGFNFEVEQLVCLTRPMSQDGRLDIDQINEAVEAEMKDTIDFITVTAEELWTVFVGYRMPELDCPPSFFEE